MTTKKPSIEELRKGRWTISDEIMGMPAQYRPTTDADLEPVAADDDEED